MPVIYTGDNGAGHSEPVAAGTTFSVDSRAVMVLQAGD